MRRILLVMVVGALMVAMLVVGMGAALAQGQGPFEARVPDEGSAGATPGLEKAVDAYCSHRRCG